MQILDRSGVRLTEEDSEGSTLELSSDLVPNSEGVVLVAVLDILERRGRWCDEVEA